MGMFSNGTEGCDYQERYCVKCKHYGDEDEGCPVWDAHLLYAGSTVPEVQEVLDILIPTFSMPPWNGRCKMFIHDPNYGQTSIEFPEAQ